MEQQSSTMLFPQEVILIIFKFLDAKSLLKSQLVNKEWNRLANDNRLWRAFFEKEQPGVIPVVEYKLENSIGDFQSWKTLLFYYRSKSWFATQKPADIEEWLTELEASFNLLRSCVHERRPIRSQHLFWLYTGVYKHSETFSDDIAKQFTRIVEDYADDIYKVLETALSKVEGQQGLVNEKADILRSFVQWHVRQKRLLDVMFTYYRYLEKKQHEITIKLEGRRIFREHVFDVLSSKLLDLGNELNASTSDSSISGALFECQRVFIEYGETFVHPPLEALPTTAELPSNKQLVVKSSDGEHFKASLLMRMSPVFRDIMDITSTQ